MSHRGQPTDLPVKPLLIVLSGQSGAGKDAVLTRMKKSDHPRKYITTVTTRPGRPNEKDSIHYRFVSVAEFQGMVKRNEMLERAKVYGNWYGVPRQPVKEALEQGLDTVVKVDVQGAATIRKVVPQAVLIFLATPSLEELIQRLKQRGTESPAELALRTSTAEGELKQMPLFDYVVFNREGKLDEAVSDIEAIITAEKRRVAPREITM